LKHYDLILIVGYFRTAASFLSVVRELGSSLSIAVLFAEAESTLRSKTEQAHLDFIEICRRFGAYILEQGESASANLTVIQQFPYDDKVVESMQRSIKMGRRVGLLTLAMAGIAQHDAFLEQFGIRRVYTPNINFTSFLLQKREAQRSYCGVQMVEVGLPFANYPVFPEFSADWIIAAPTLFSFHHEAGKQQFLNSVLKLLSQIPADEVVIYKSHNGHCKDYFAPKIHYFLASCIARVPGGSAFLESIRRSSFRWLQLQAERVLTCKLQQAVLRRAKALTTVTSSAGVALEAFLPAVKKGVIGGLSNTIWGALYFELPFYNCVDMSNRCGSSELLNKKSDNFLDLNLQYFRVPFCNNDITTDTREIKIIRPEERSGDLIKSILSDLKKIRGLGSKRD
jgi:hypothetical protein